MELLLEIVSSERFMLGDNAAHRFLPAGGVIGRSSGCDWVIPDQTRHLSGRHAIISYETGQFYITDISTNGVYLNGPDPLPRNVAVPLQDEDRLVMGEYQFRVSVNVNAGASVPANPVRSAPSAPPALGKGAPGTLAADNPMAAVDAFIAERQQVTGDPARGPDWHARSVSMPDNLRPEQEAFTPPNVAADAAMTLIEPAVAADILPDNWMDLSIVPSVPPAVSDARSVPDVPANPPPALGPVIPNPGRRHPVSEPPPPMSPQTPPLRTATPPVAPASSANAVTAFAEGLGIRPDELPSGEADALLRRAGALLRQCLQGLVSGAHARASMKNEFRLDMTLVNASGNNPIKFSAHGDQLVRHLLSRESGSFLSLEQAVDECHEDFQHHQLAMMAGMQHAFLELIQQLSPDELEQRFDRLKSKGLAFSSKGARYWDAYRELHQELQEEDDIFASMFVEPFARAYDEQIRKLKQASKKKE